MCTLLLLAVLIIKKKYSFQCAPVKFMICLLIFQVRQKTEECTRIPSVPSPGKWYYISDSRVMEASESSVLNSQAYLLFYERIL